MNTFSGMHITSQLRQERIARNWRQSDLAEQLGTAVGTIKRWERGRQQPGPYFRAKLCALFGKSAEELGLLPGRRPTTATVQKEEMIWSLPFRRNLFFIGREELLEQLHTMLTRKTAGAALPRSYSLHGLGGIGKTQLAIEYAYRHRREYHAVLWVQAQTQASLTFSFGKIAAALALPEHAEEDHHQMILAVLSWLNQHKNWLLIFDNVEDPSLIKHFLPASDQGTLLLTTQLHSLGSLARPIELPPMTSEEGCAFLLARTHYSDQVAQDASFDAEQQIAAQTIATQMGGLPLALEQAGAYIDATGCSLLEYMQLFQQMQHRLLDEHESSSDHPLSVSRTFLLAFQQVEQRHPLAAELLTVCAFLDAEAIPEQFFLQSASSLCPTFTVMQSDPLAMTSALKVLRSYSLLQRQASTRTVSLHRLVQIVLKGRLTKQEQRLWAQRVLTAMQHLFPTNEEMQANYMSLGEQLLTHAQACLSLAELYDENQAQFVSLMIHVAVYLCKRARFEEAEPLFEVAIRTTEHTLGEHYLLLAEALHGLADLFREQGKYSQATSLCERALDLRRQTLTAQHPQIADSLDLLGLLSSEQGNYGLAERYYQDALRIREQASGPEHLQTASSLLNLGTLYKDRGQGMYELAEPLLQRAIRIWEKALGPEHPQVARALNSLGLLYEGQENYESARLAYQRALQIWEKTRGPEHPQVATVLNNLGKLYYQQGNYELAELYFQRTIHMRERILGPEHPRIGSTLNNLGSTYYEQGNYKLAELYYQRALQLWEKALGSDHPDLGTPLTNLGELYAQQKRYELAEQFHWRALHLWEKAWGSEHPDMAYVYNGLANVFREQGKYEQSLTLYQRALKLRQQHLSPQHPDLAETLHDLARLYHLQRDYTQARSLYQQALDIYQPVFGSDHLRTKQAEEVIAQLTQEMAQPKQTGSDEYLASEPEGSLLCACGCGRPIDRSKSHGEPRRFFSAACRQRVYRDTLRNKRHTPYEVSHNRRK